MINAEGYTTDTVGWKAAAGPSTPQTQSIVECLFVQIESKICDWNDSKPRRCTILTALFDSGLTILREANSKCFGMTGYLLADGMVYYCCS